MNEDRVRVIEDVLARIIEEHGVETMVLDWAILNKLVEDDSSEKSEKPSE